MPNKLRRVEIIVWELKSSTLCVRWEIIFTCLHIGHYHMTHQYIFEWEPSPLCQRCDTLLTVEHILIDCPNINAAMRNTFLDSHWVKFLVIMSIFSLIRFYFFNVVISIALFNFLLFLFRSLLVFNSVWLLYSLFHFIHVFMGYILESAALFFVTVLYII